MKTIYLFDVDGTLTPAKSKIDQGFAKAFYGWQRDREVYIVSGGSFPRIVDQLSRKVVDKTRGVFSCMGNAYYKKIPSTDGYSSWTLEYENKFTVAKQALFFSELERYVMNSEYHTKTGRHYEERVGMVNFSIVGRNASMSERKEYEEYDKEHEFFSNIFSELREAHFNHPYKENNKRRLGPTDYFYLKYKKYSFFVEFDSLTEEHSEHIEIKI